MDLNMRSPPNSNAQSKNFQFHGSSQTQQVGAFSLANTATQNSYVYPRNIQIVNIQSGASMANNAHFQNPGSFNNFPKTSTSSKGTGEHWNVLSGPANSLTGVRVQMAATATQNSSLIRNVNTSALPQGNTRHPMQNVPQNIVNPFMTVDNCNTQPLQNYSASVSTSAYHQSSKHSLSSRTMSTQNAYFYTNGPGAYQVPHGVAPSHHFNSQQSFSCVVFPVEQNVENQTSGPNPSMTVALQPQQCVSSHLNPTQYALSSDCHNRNATQVLSPTTNGNSSLSYQPPPLQINHGQFVQPQSLTSVQNYHSSVLGQNNNTYSVQFDQKHRSVASSQETNKGGSTMYLVNGHQTDNQFSNESTKSSVKFGDNFLNSAGPVPQNESTQLSRISEHVKNPSNANAKFPGNLSKNKGKITKDSLALDLQKLQKLRNLYLKEAHNIKIKMHLASKQNKQASDHAVQGQNPNISLPSSNIGGNSLLPVPPLHDANQGSPLPPYNATHNKPFSSVSSDSGPMKDDSLLIKNKNNYLSPILTNLLKGTGDEDMLMTIVGKEGTHKERELATAENSSSTLLVPSGDISETNTKNIDGPPRLTFKTSPVSFTQESFTSPQNSLDFELSSAPAKSQLEKMQIVADERKGATESCGLDLKGSLESSSQNIDALDETSKKLPKECTADISSLFPQSENPEEQIDGKSENTSAMSRSHSLTESGLILPESGLVHKLSGAGNAYGMKGACSWEELKTSLALWGKNIPTLLCKYLSGGTEPAGSSSSIDDGAGGKEVQQKLENLPSTLAHKNQTEVTNEATQHFALSSLGKNIDAMNTNLLKGCEPQVAIVTPLILSKDSIKNEMEKNNRSTEIMHPVIEEGGTQSSQDISSAVAHTDRWKGASSPSNSGQNYKDSDLSRKALKFTEENGVVKAETKTRSTCDLDNCSAVQLKHHESQFITGDSLQSEMYTGDISKLAQNDVECQTGSGLLGPRDAAENKETDTMFQISSVCTLVQGDEYYNSQIASIFSNGLLKPSTQNDTSEEFVPSLRYKDPSSCFSKNNSGTNIGNPEGNGLLPSPSSLSVAVAEVLKSLPTLDAPPSCKTSGENGEIKAKTITDSGLLESMSLLGKLLDQDVSHSGVPCADVASNKQLLPEKEERPLNASISDGMCIARKDSIVEPVFAEENQAHSESSVELSLNLLTDQLAELSKEFPYGIGNLAAFNILEGSDSVTKVVEKEGKGRTETPVESLNSRDTEDQINIRILSLQQEVFPESNHHSSSKSEESHKDDQPKMDTEKNLNVSYIKSEQCSASTSAPRRTMVENKKSTFCCLRKFMSVNYAVEPCSCQPTPEQKVELCSQSATKLQDTIKTEDSRKAELRLNSQSPTLTFVSVNESVPSGDQHNETLHKSFVSREVKDPSKVDKATSPLVLLDKLETQNPKRTKEQLTTEFSTQATSLSVKTEIEKIIEKHDISTRKCISIENAQSCSIRENFKMAPGRKLCKMASKNQRSENVVVKSRKDTYRRRRIEIKSGTGCERYKIKRDSKETHIIKGPKRKKHKVMEKCRILATQHSGNISTLQLSSFGSVSERSENLERNSLLPSQEPSHEKKFEKRNYLEERYGYRKGEHNQASPSEHRKDESEYSKTESEQQEHRIKTINLQKYAYSEERKNAWKYRSLHLDNRTPLWQKQRDILLMGLKNFVQTKRMYWILAVETHGVKGLLTKKCILDELVLFKGNKRRTT
ncbi:hypothetical protein JRQ81_015322 [Phrynocephalus forsythii]|uniref:Retroelement silencing factor 1 n=1 Tax=Phrynocephalus forsythii TaxID=171643 RepID=A0A9Q1B1V8_9SAUR|nr:hypothetical protein JRQ81_015322 [Phrynocephalus forsythii]